MVYTAILSMCRWDGFRKSGHICYVYVCSSVCVRPPVCVPSVYVFVHLFVFHLCMCLSTCLCSICVCVCPSVCMCSSINVSVCFCVSVCPSVCVVYMFVHVFPIYVRSSICVYVLSVYVHVIMHLCLYLCLCSYLCMGSSVCVYAYCMYIIWCMCTRNSVVIDIIDTLEVHDNRRGSQDEESSL